ncbi:MAG: hypothetical protein PHY88_00145 [Candidatus Omnitrophica bacterium]|nr:hypothetical protein [Candidatus Omnitrophota bacterium]
MNRRKNPPKTEEMLECSAGLLKGAMFFLGLSIENALKGFISESRRMEDSPGVIIYAN